MNARLLPSALVKFLRRVYDRKNFVLRFITPRRENVVRDNREGSTIEEGGGGEQRVITLCGSCIILSRTTRYTAISDVYIAAVLLESCKTRLSGKKNVIPLEFSSFSTVKSLEGLLTWGLQNGDYLRFHPLH